MNRDVKVSVICISFNHGKYIGQTLENIISQKVNFKYQIIVHDDASTDNSQDVIKSYAEKYPDIIIPILQEKNKFTSIGLKGIFDQYIYPEVKGEYIAQCEGDDYWCDNNKLQKQIDFLETHENYSGCVHNSWFLDTKTEKMVLFNKNAEAEYDLKFEDMINGIMGRYHGSSLVFRRKYTGSEPCYYNAIPGVRDYPKAILLTANGNIRFFPEVMSVYRYCSTPTSWTSVTVASKHDIQKRVKDFNYRIGMLEQVKECYPDKAAIVQKAIDNKIYEKLMCMGDLKAICNNKIYRKMYEKETIKTKLKILIKSILYSKKRAQLT